MKFTIRNGKTSDVSWISQLLRDGSMAGHFGPTVGSQAQPLLATVLSGGRLNMANARQGTPMIRSMQTGLSVLECDAAPAAFLLTLQEGNEMELHLAGTRPAFKKHGCFKALVTDITTRNDGLQRVFARCYRKSTVALTALQTMGFVVVDDADPIELELRQA